MIDAYFEEASRLLEGVRSSQKSAMEEAANKIAESIENNGIVHLFGCGHSHILTEEVFYRAGGLAPIHPIFHEPLMLHEGAARSSQLERKNDYTTTFLEEEEIRPEDILIVLSTSGRNPVPIDAALYAKEQGAYVIVITSLTYSKSQPSRHTNGKHLYEVGDLVIDNGAPIGDAVLNLSGFDVPFAPVSTLIGTAILQSIFAKSIQIMQEDNFSPPVFLSGNIQAADEHNNRLLEKYSKRIPLLTKGME